MPEIAKIDLAWEFVHALDPSPARDEALAIIEQAGGKDPRHQRETECISPSSCRRPYKNGESAGEQRWRNKSAALSN